MKIIFLKSLILALIVYAFCNGCVGNKSIVKRTIDTTYIEIHDTAFVKQKDSLAPFKIYNNIDTIFQEIEKDCPNESEKLPAFKKEIKDDCTHQSLSGGSMDVYFPKLKQYVKVVFNGNSATAVDNGVIMKVDDKEETTIIEKPGFFQRLKGDFEIIGAMILVAVVAFFIGKIT